MYLTLFCYSRDIELYKIKLNLEKSGGFWRKVGDFYIILYPQLYYKKNVCVS